MVLYIVSRGFSQQFLNEIFNFGSMWKGGWVRPKSRLFALLTFKVTMADIANFCSKIMIPLFIIEDQYEYTIVWCTQGYDYQVVSKLSLLKGVLCLRCFLRLWKNNRLSRKPCKRRSDLVCLFVCFIYLVLKHSFDSRLSQDLYGNEKIYKYKDVNIN